MRVVTASLVAALAACSASGGTGPAGFSITVQVAHAPDVGGCFVTWHAHASDPNVIVSYTTSISGPGTFTDTLTLYADVRTANAFTVTWDVSAGTYANPGQQQIGANCS